jgi:hypothetical protein
MRRFLLTSIGVLSLGASADAGPGYAVAWWSIDSGSGTMSGPGGYTLAATVGQADAGAMYGGSFEVVGGFWAAVLPDSPPCPGDLDADGDVDLADLGQLLQAYGAGPNGDTDGDGDTDLHDLGGVLQVFGAACPS